tara:strand:- start:80 stop:193 length:114 start_codon:yes stop_codon:yes gene_type:complete
MALFLFTIAEIEGKTSRGYYHDRVTGRFIEGRLLTCL